jgi:hypothetical protein
MTRRGSRGALDKFKVGAADENQRLGVHHIHKFSFGRLTLRSALG